MNPTSLLRMAKWARRRQSWRRFLLICSVVAGALVIGLVEWLGYWPDWATAERTRP